MGSTVGFVKATISVVGIVDDDEGIRQALDGLLRSAGFQVMTFASAEAFLSSTHLQLTACLILDLRMPGMDGLKLQRRLATSGHPIPIIVLTAHGDDEARARAMGAGAIAFLTKPFDGDALLVTVTQALTAR
jgi:FixJ family two-component response regulator